MAFPGLNFKTVLAGTFTVPPVNGFLAVLAAFLTGSNVAKPRRLTVLPFFNWVSIKSNVASTDAVVSLIELPVLLATAAISSYLLMFDIKYLLMVKTARAV